MGGLLSYGREYMPGPDTRSGMDQLRGLLGAAQPYAEAVGGLLGYQPGMAEALAAEQEMKRQRLRDNPGKRISEVLPINEPWPANDAFGAGLMGAFGGSIKAVSKGLDMSHAARMARAREMGFDVDNPVYHGTSADIDAMRPSERGAIGPGVYSSPYLGVAQRYGDAVYPLSLKGKEFNATGMSVNGAGGKYISSTIAGDDVRRLLEGVDIEKESQRMADSLARYDGAPGDAVWILLSSKFGKEEAQRRIQSLGYDHIRGNQDGIEIVTLDPRNIRSIHAAFDPAKRNSADLLASVGGLGLLGYGGINGGASE